MARPKRKLTVVRKSDRLKDRSKANSQWNKNAAKGKPNKSLHNNQIRYHSAKDPGPDKHQTKEAARKRVKQICALKIERPTGKNPFNNREHWNRRTEIFNARKQASSKKGKYAVCSTKKVKQKGGITTTKIHLKYRKYPKGHSSGKKFGKYHYS